MKKTVLEIYALAVCFFRVACFVVCAGFAIYDAVQIAVPEFTLNRYQYDRLQSNEAYRQAPTNLTGEKALQELRQAPDEEITKRRRSETERILGSERHGGAQGLLRMLIIMLVDSAAFMFTGVWPERQEVRPNLPFERTRFIWQRRAFISFWARRSQMKRAAQPKR